MPRASAHDHLEPELGPRGEAEVPPVAHLQIVVEEADGAEGSGDQHHQPDVDVAEIRPEEGRDQGGEEDQQPAHGGGPRLDLVRLRPDVADVLADRQPAQLADEPGAHQPGEDERRDHRPRHAEGDVAEDVEGREDLPQAATAARRASVRALRGICGQQPPDHAVELHAARSLDQHHVAGAHLAGRPVGREIGVGQPGRLGTRRRGPGGQLARQLAHSGDRREAEPARPAAPPRGGSAAPSGPSSSMSPSTAIRRAPAATASAAALASALSTASGFEL